MLRPRLITLRIWALLWQLFMLALVFSMSQYPRAYSSFPLAEVGQSPTQLQVGVAASAIVITCLQLLLNWVGGGLEPLLLLLNSLAALATTWYWLGPLGELTLLYIQMVLIAPALLLQVLGLCTQACCGPKLLE